MRTCYFTAFSFLLQTTFARQSAVLWQDEAYDRGHYGPAPATTYRTIVPVSPLINIVKYDDRCATEQKFFLCPHGSHTKSPSLMILDSNGTLIWISTDKIELPWGLNVQIYRGAPYLTFGSGRATKNGGARGRYFMLNASYDPVFVFGAAGRRYGGKHEFTITKQGTALVSLHKAKPFDLSLVGGATRGFILDSIVQEFDIETKQLLFHWAASDHFPVNATFRERGGDGRTEASAFDFFHLNSAEKDPKGNYLITARNTHTITYIEGSTGKVLWNLGGKNNMFQDLSDGRATDFRWQHHARWRDNYTSITLFDNQSALRARNLQNASRGVHIGIDTAAMTAWVINEYSSPHPIFSPAQGSHQVLDNGNVLIGYGHCPAFIEYASDGEVLCDYHFGPRASFRRYSIHSYQVFRHAWVGRPRTSPTVVMDVNEDGSVLLWVSWNGATEVAAWFLEGAYAAAGPFQPIRTIVKLGFETSTTVGEEEGRPFVRFKALDKAGNVLGCSKTLETGQASRLTALTGYVDYFIDSEIPAYPAASGRHVVKSEL